MTVMIHEPGNCPHYGHSDCSGVGRFVPDPFAEEIHGDSTPYWNCDGGLYESAMDI